jgi:hypothetical protein
MQNIDGSALSGLLTQLDGLRATLPLTGAPQPRLAIPIPPIHPPVITPLMRGTATIGYVVTPFGAPVPTSVSVTLKAGILWVQATLFGSSFSGTSGYVGIPFAAATMKAVGSVTFSGGNIVLDAAATLSLKVDSSVSPATGPAGDPVGQDFLAAKLTPFSGATVTLAPAGATMVLAGTSSATIYGQLLSLTPSASAIITELVNAAPYLGISCNISQKTFAVSSSASPEVVMAGKAAIVGAAVIFPIFDAAPASLPAPSDAWGNSVFLGPGLSATIAPLTASITLAGASFAITPAHLLGLVANGVARPRETYLLWTPPAAPSPLPPAQPDLALPSSQITLDFVPGSLVFFSEAPDQEVTNAVGNLTAILDRPLDAGGQRLNLQGLGSFTRVHTAASILVGAGSPLSPNATTSIALVAENAVIPVFTPNGFLLSGTLTGNVVSGGLAIGFPANGLVPTFPDPYAAAYVTDQGRELVAGVSAQVAWTATTPPALTVVLLRTQKPAGLATRTVPVPGTLPMKAASPLVGPAGAGCLLLDVSTNADLWGVGLDIGGVAQFNFAGLVLQAPAADTTVFTMCGISWEPMVDTSSVPTWLSAYSPDDGVPTTFLVAVTNPAPILPVQALKQYQAAAGTSSTQATFTLPFGINANLADTGKSGSSGPSYTIPTIQFPAQNMAGARVLSITGGPAKPLEANLPGTALCGYSTRAYGAQVLGMALPSVAKFWDDDFGPTGKGFIPVSRVDLSGYGTSMFSDWHDPSLTDVGIVRALFSVLLGRTAHEIITAQTWILPWCIRLQRTITFDRSDGGEVIKHDSGWKAVAPGTFEMLKASPVRILPGPIVSLNNVRNIQFTQKVIKAGSNQFNPCTFDADVAFASGIQIAADGKNPAATAVCTGIQGYADDTVTINTALSGADIITLMQQVGRVSGETGCIARLGGKGTTQFTLTAASIGAAVATGPTAMLQTAIFGTPLLPKDGQWSVARRAKGSNSPQPVAQGTPVPLTQGTSAGATPPAGPGTFGANCFRLLDPEDAQSVDSPQTFYGILQGTGTSKTLFEHPLINDAGTGLGFGNTPGLADAGALLGVPGMFPDIGNVLQIPANQGGLPISTDGFVKTYNLGAAASPPQPQPPDRALLDIAIVHLVLSYSANGAEYSGTLILDATPGAPNWSLTLQNLSFEAKVDGLGSDPLVTVSGGFQAGASILPGFTGLQVSYGSALDDIKSILTGLGDLASHLGGTAQLNVGFSGNTLTVQQGFTLPTIPLGFGEITNLGLNLGFTTTIPSSLAFSVGIGSKQDPFQWVVSPLAGTGAIVLGVQDGGPDVYIEAGLGLGLSISVAVASGSASIIVGLSLEVGTNAITITATLTGNAEVDVLGGLASASLTLSAAIAITVENSPHQADLAAQCSVGIHISICWVINVSFDGSWGFSETIALN